mmetsp:Transcript_75619/g.133611  ORF Transcript_75619/g.133611 Transcript_75619/m.133611 type:complete len:217 (-) Transcript_75619:1194-1844(-)
MTTIPGSGGTRWTEDLPTSLTSLLRLRAGATFPLLYPLVWSNVWSFFTRLVGACFCPPAPGIPSWDSTASLGCSAPGEWANLKGAPLVLPHFEKEIESQAKREAVIAHAGLQSHQPRDDCPRGLDVSNRPMDFDLEFPPHVPLSLPICTHPLACLCPEVAITGIHVDGDLDLFMANAHWLTDHWANLGSFHPFHTPVPNDQNWGLGHLSRQPGATM